MIVLASGSRIRRTMLENAGVAFEVQPADIDEEAITQRLQEEKTTAETLAQRLACEKALAVSKLRAEEVVIGSDQVLELDGALLSKVSSLDEALERLCMMSGRSHRLVTAQALCRKGEVLRSTVTPVRVTMREYDRGTAEAYLRRNMPWILSSVACYEIEKDGIALIEAIEGSTFAALGLDLIETITMLKQEGALT